jgi:general secretion pathway protein J
MRRPVRGFTLLEVLVATALLAAGLVLAFATVRTATAVSQRGEALVASNEVMRGVLDVLRSRLQSALPVAFEPALEGQSAMRFDGSSQRLRFVAEVPGYFGRGGPYLHDVSARRSARGEGMELALGLELVSAGVRVPEQPARAPEVIADGLREVRMRYRGINADDGQLGPWQDSWEWATQQRPPLLVSIAVQPLQGPAWPELVVAIGQARPEVGR